MKAEKRVLVCGGRDYSGEKQLHEILWEQFPTMIIHGNARGADRLAGQFAEANGVDVAIFPANWNGDGPKAGHLRNQRMLNFMKPHLVVAFAGGKGTADMVERARKAKIEVIEVVV